MGKQGPCYHCGVASTPLWRNGPPDKPVLCNACGSRWRTKGTLVNYTPLHSRLDPEDYEDHRIGRMKSISLKKKEEKLNKRKVRYENTMAMDREFTPDYHQSHQKNIDEDMSNRSSFGSAVSNSESCAQFGSADASELTGPSQSAVWDSMIPSRKRTCVTRPKQSSVEKLTKDLYTIYHEQASQFSGTSEEDLLYESDAPMVSVEIGHGSVLIRHPSTMAKEEESEASSLSVDNKLCRAYGRYSNAAPLLSLNDSKSVNNSFSPVEEVKKLKGQVTQLGQLKRDKYNHEKFQILCNHKSPLSYIDLTEIANFEVFQGYLTDEEQQCLLKYLPSVDTSAGFDSFENIFASAHIKENLTSLQQLLADGVLDSSFSGVETEDCKLLKRLALCSSSKFKWIEQYNVLKKQAEESTEEQISKSGAKTCSAGTLLSGNRFRGKHNHIDTEAKHTMKSPERRVLKVDYKKKAPLQNEMPYFIPTPENVFAFPDGGGGGGDDDGRDPSDFLNKPWKPLTRKLRIPAAVLSPYRLLVLIRLVVLAFFLAWRVKHQNPDAPWLWGMSVICELWFSFSWILDQLPKLNPVNRLTDLTVLREKFETPNPNNPTGKSDLPGMDIFVSTADPEKEPPLVTANTILSILAADYPVEKLACYVSDDGGALLTFEAMAEAASFAYMWVPFCRKHNIEPRNPDSYFSLKKDPYKNKMRQDFVKDRRRIKREYDEFKVRTNGLPDSIRRRSDAYNAREEIKALKKQREQAGDELLEPIKVQKATWMADGTHWPGTWLNPAPEHFKGDHAGIIQVMLKPPSDEPLHGTPDDDSPLDFSEVDIRLPMLVYVSREKRPGYDHNKKAGAMNALVRASAVMSNGPFILNLDCDHYIYNSEALREGICFMMDRNGDRICYVQFPQRFEGIDPSDRYANHNTVFFDINMRALDGIQGPVYVGTGCLFRRIALYGFDPPRTKSQPGFFSCCFGKRKKQISSSASNTSEEVRALRMGDSDDEGMDLSLLPKKFGNSNYLVDSIPVAEFQGRPLADHPSVRNGRPPGALTIPRDLLDATTVAEAISVISCWYEDKTEWGGRIGWIYGSVTEDVVTGYRMHNRGWRSIYCVTKRDAFRGTAPINLTDRLHQVLRWATGSVEIFFSRNNALLAGGRLKFFQRIAYLNVGIYPFTSIFLIAYCFLPALSLFSGQFIVASLNITFLIYLLIISLCLVLLALLEIKWSGIALEEWWRNEQFWLIGGVSAHIAAVFQGILKVIAGIEISFTLTSKSSGDENDDEFAELYLIKWTSLMIPPLVIIMVNLIAIAVGFSRTIYSTSPEWSKLLGGVFFSFWVLAHLYPFAKGLMGRGGRTPTIVFVWAGLITITISLLWVAINPPSGGQNTTDLGGGFQFP